MKYIAFLRGINSGKNPSTKMVDLKRVFSEFGFRDAETVLASGNVIFSAKQSLSVVTKVLNSKLSKKLGFSTYALVITENTIKDLIASNPFGNKTLEKDTKYYVSLVEDGNTSILPLKDDGYEIRKGPEGMIFSTVDLTSSGSPDLMKVLDQNWKENTTRGWSTIEKIGKKLQKMSNQKQILQTIRTVNKTKSDERLKERFIKRIKDGFLSRDENPYDHFCIMFLAYDPTEKKYFIGDHKKSGLWLFSGGHTDKGETPEETLFRESKEEWGIEVVTGKEKARYLTISEIENQNHNCKLHYDIWYVFEKSRAEFMFDEGKLLKEFSEFAWMTSDEIRSLKTHKSTLAIVDAVEKK